MICAIDHDDSGYCFGGPFVLELAATNDIVAGKVTLAIHCIFDVVELGPS